MLTRIIDFIEAYLTYKPRAVTSSVVRSDHKIIELINANNDKIQALFCNKNSEQIIIFSHGNATHIYDMQSQFSLLDELKVSYLVYDYPGYGKSSGKPNEKNLYASHEAIFNYVKENLNFKDNNIILFGQSLGGAVACDLASKQKVKALILESTFTCTHDMSKLILKLPLHKFSINKYNNLEKIKKITCQTLIIHGDKDQTIPVDHAHQLFNNSNKNTTRLFIIAECDHVSQRLLGGSEYSNLIKEYVLTIIS